MMAASLLQHSSVGRLCSQTKPSVTRQRPRAHVRKIASFFGRSGASVTPKATQDAETSRTAYYQAYINSQNSAVKVPGLQEFASAVWERRRRIPSQVFHDPLERLFDEFDKDGDGHLTAEEVALALQSRGVEISADVAQMYIDAVDLNDNSQVEKEEFGDLIYRMARADLKGEMPKPKASILKRGKSLQEVKVFQLVLERDPTLLHIPGLQEFAASVWDRRRHVPSAVWKDPLELIFEEFDEDKDGHLTAEELVAAMASRGVVLTTAQAQLIIDAVDVDGNSTVEKEEFPALIYGLATLDRLSRQNSS